MSRPSKKHQQLQTTGEVVDLTNKDTNEKMPTVFSSSKKREHRDEWSPSRERDEISYDDQFKTTQSSRGRQIVKPIRLQAEIPTQQPMGNASGSRQGTGAAAKLSGKARTSHEPPSTYPELVQERDGLLKEYNDLRQQYQSKCEEHKNVKASRATANQNYERERHEKVEMKKENKLLHAKILDLQRSLAAKEEQHKNELEMQEQSFMSARESLNKLVRKTASTGESDDVVRTKLLMLKARIRPWAMQCGNASLVLADKELVRDIVQKAAVDSSGANVKRLTELVCELSTAPSLLLNILLSYKIFDEFFRQPFFGANDWFDSRIDIKAALDEMLQKTTDLATSSVWRSDTRQLFTAMTGSGTWANRYTHTLKQRCEKLAADFVDFDARYLLKSVTDEESRDSFPELVNIFHEAAQLASRLWCQKTLMRVSVHTDIVRRNTIFEINSPFLEAHRLMGCDNDDHSFDGQSVDLIIEPGLLAFGDNEGENYKLSKVWLKATALIIPEQHPGQVTGARDEGAMNKWSPTDFIPHSDVIGDDGEESQREHKRAKSEHRTTSDLKNLGIIAQKPQSAKTDSMKHRALGGAISNAASTGKLFDATVTGIASYFKPTPALMSTAAESAVSSHCKNPESLDKPFIKIEFESDSLSPAGPGNGQNSGPSLTARAAVRPQIKRNSSRDCMGSQCDISQMSMLDKILREASSLEEPYKARQREDAKK